MLERPAWRLCMCFAAGSGQSTESGDGQWRDQGTLHRWGSQYGKWHPSFPPGPLLSSQAVAAFLPECGALQSLALAADCEGYGRRSSRSVALDGKHCLRSPCNERPSVHSSCFVHACVALNPHRRPFACLYLETNKGVL